MGWRDERGTHTCLCVITPLEPLKEYPKMREMPQPEKNRVVRMVPLPGERVLDITTVDVRNPLADLKYVHWSGSYITVPFRTYHQMPLIVETARFAEAQKI